MALLAVAPGDSATATYRAGTLALNLRYEMTCGQPGPGPVSEGQETLADAGLPGKPKVWRNRVTHSPGSVCQIH